ncbi:MAG: MBL fold metallo-hydrolase [Chloroflexota bacterium]
MSTIEVHNLGSGSSGNALLLRAAGQSLLIDCGIPRAAIRRALASHDLGLSALTAVAVSHEHGDHVGSLEHLPAPVPRHATPGTLAALGRHRRDAFPLAPGETVQTGAFALTAIAVSHDAAQPCGYFIEAAGRRITVMTDLGRAPLHALDLLGASDLIVLEANYDPHMLACGPYPPRLKSRITSGSGHLSNDDCGDLLARALTGRSHLPVVWLAHLSKTNNRPRLAEETVTRRLQLAGLPVQAIAMIRSGGNAWLGEPGPAGHPRPVQLGLGL